MNNNAEATVQIDVTYFSCIPLHEYIHGSSNQTLISTSHFKLWPPVADLWSWVKSLGLWCSRQ